MKTDNVRILTEKSNKANMFASFYVKKVNLIGTIAVGKLIG